jgi:hypothetical protein
VNSGVGKEDDISNAALNVPRHYIVGYNLRKISAMRLLADDGAIFAVQRQGFGAVTAPNALPFPPFTTAQPIRAASATMQQITVAERDARSENYILTPRTQRLSHRAAVGIVVME